MADINGILRDLQQERDRLDQAIKALQPLTSRNGLRPVRTGSGVARRTLSAAARRKIALAQKRRWAKVKAAKSKGSGTRVVSIVARRKMAASQKARRARERAQQSKKAA